MKQKRIPDPIFGIRLKQLRSERCLTGAQLCDQFNEMFGAKLNASTISRYENGTQEPMLNTVDLLARFFDVSPVYLMGASDDRTNTASNIQNSAVVQGNSATTMIVRNGAAQERELSDNEIELLRIYELLDVKGRHALMSAAFKLEEKQTHEEG